MIEVLLQRLWMTMTRLYMTMKRLIIMGKSRMEDMDDDEEVVKDVEEAVDCDV